MTTPTNEELDALVREGRDPSAWRDSADLKTLCIDLADAISALRAENARLREDRDTFHMDYRMKCDVETKTLRERIAALESAPVAAEVEAMAKRLCDELTHPITDWSMLCVNVAAMLRALSRQNEDEQAQHKRSCELLVAQVTRAERAEAEVAALRQDAARYRYQFSDELGAWDYHNEWISASKDQVDVMIDAALAAKAGGT